MTSPYYQDEYATLYHGDCLEVLAELPDASVDAVVTDPPYGLEFMGKEWDAPWADSGVNADAGFRGGGLNQTKGLPSFTGSTNPKCLTCKGTRRGRRDGTAKVAVCLCPDGGRFPNTRAVEMRAFQDWCAAWTAECLRVLKPGGHLLAFGGSRTWHRLAAAVEDAGFEIRDSIAWLYGSGFPKSLNVSKAIATGGGRPEDIRRAAMGDDYAPSGRGRVNYDHGGGSTMNGSVKDFPLTPDAERWQGWGTALKPAFEPIVVARKPLAGTVATNVLQYGTGALHIDACRTAMSEADSECDRTHGRWPTNVILDDTTAADLDKQTGVSRSRVGKPRAGAAGDGWGMRATGAEYDDEGGASRFFPVLHYEAKATTAERPKVNGVQHPTVKPLDLMQWLVRLVARPGALVLDPFAGSGTTLEACIAEGMRCIGIEREEKYLALIQQRLSKDIDIALDLGGIA